MKSVLFVSTYPFGRENSLPREILKKTPLKVIYNPLNRKLKPSETAELAKDADIIIAGTENLEPLIRSSERLKFISRVGIGLDSVPLRLCKEKGIRVSYTPDAVTPAVTELTLGLILDLFRDISYCDREIRNGKWSRPVGRRIEHSVIGMLGFGRVGKGVARLLSSFRPKEVLVNDIKDIQKDILSFREKFGLNIRFAEKEEIYSVSDLVTVHMPLTSETRGLVNRDVLHLFRKDAFLLNTARGEIVHENDLYDSLKNREIQGAALDVFSEEPYKGRLRELENIILTEHIGSCSVDCRIAMERESAEEALNFFEGKKLLREVENYDGEF
ncbi:MAG TPA: phosphoglycerate dehydrogenase [Leptospiraceae bacterium]|nr:phosphoglycerate dehydrogenase [Leptospiraceae bacterium]HMY67645.1 phosphoglycerate dehydrogenase [Leptospiraceae bacterium]HMZ57684.1 phosphoglycerate dehydrogenase [Leptospiraceae bacterium]HNH08172.1 phosphoglycerate dehydrogenase [Leptospiraceae bacterium]